MMILIATLSAFMAAFLLKENGTITLRIEKLVPGLCGVTLAFVCSMIEYGNLRGFFVALGLISLVGTILVFVPKRQNPGSSLAAK